MIFVFFVRIHPRYKRDVAHRLTLGARAVAYNEKNVHFQGPFPKEILSSGRHVNITYDQTVSVTRSINAFEVGLSRIWYHHTSFRHCLNLVIIREPGVLVLLLISCSVNNNYFL